MGALRPPHGAIPRTRLISPRETKTASLIARNRPDRRDEGRKAAEMLVGSEQVETKAVEHGQWESKRSVTPMSKAKTSGSS